MYGYLERYVGFERDVGRRSRLESLVNIVNPMSKINKSDEEISDIKNLGEKSIEEIKKLLGRL
jgi:DNA-directed RNA polymerase alpha subunit